MKKQAKIFGILIMIVMMLLPLSSSLASNYTMRLGASVPIYHGPGYDWGYAKPVGEDGVYTIVEEQWDEQGEKWGRLKSGAGWVNLSWVQGNAGRQDPIWAAFADEALIASGCYQQILTERPTELMVKLAIRPRETLSNVQLFLLEWREDGLYPAAPYCILNSLTPDMPLIAGVVFWGDMTAYGISFRDEKGNERCYSLSISGRDGSLVIEEMH